MGFGDVLSGANDLLGTLANTTEGRGQIPDIISMHPEVPVGYRQRDLITWRIPGRGYVEMYINPQQLSISESKVISQQRTKGGYIIQYWGEELPTIKISGNTGSSGIEGINVLRQVYRSEQDAFKIVAQKLSDNLLKLTKASAKNIDKTLEEVSDQTLLPTLGSLAVSVELFYQGWLFKGYFKDFSVNESTSQGVGLFTYDMTFVVLERRGFRNNFMPWHRSPAKVDSANNPTGFNHADSKTTPYSFKGEYVP